MKAHPYYLRFRELFDNETLGWHLQWEGDGWRFQDIDFPSEQEILTGYGAQRHGGRLNFKSLFPVIYASLSEIAALKESSARAARYGLRFQ